jgi:hypothetical protein
MENSLVKCAQRIEELEKYIDDLLRQRVEMKDGGGRAYLCIDPEGKTGNTYEFTGNYQRVIDFAIELANKEMEQMKRFMTDIMYPPREGKG